MRLDFLTFAITGPSTITLSVGMETFGQLTGAGKKVRPVGIKFVIENYRIDENFTYNNYYN